MTRTELIERWKPIIMAVFVAENKVMPLWEERLREAAKDGEKIDEVCDGYVTAIAEEIISKMSDEQLKELET